MAKKKGAEVFLQVDPMKHLLWISLGGLTPQVIRLTKKQAEVLAQDYNLPICG